jgi:hypothetical protein
MVHILARSAGGKTRVNRSNGSSNKRAPIPPASPNLSDGSPTLSTASPEAKRVEAEQQRHLNELLAAQGCVVSEHALVCYFERVLGYDLGEIASRILTSAIREQADAGGDGTYAGDGFSVRVKGRIITTVFVPGKEAELGS